MLPEFTRATLRWGNEEKDNDFGDYSDGDVDFELANGDNEDEDKDEDECFELCTSAARQQQ